jgi:hypothetical protein
VKTNVPLRDFLVHLRKHPEELRPVDLPWIGEDVHQ